MASGIAVVIDVGDDHVFGVGGGGGVRAVGKLRAGVMAAKCESAVAVAQKNRQFDIAGIAAGALPVGDRQIELAVVVEIAGGDPARIPQHGRADDAGFEGAVAVAQQDHVSAGVGRVAGERADHVQVAVVVEIADRPSARIVAGDIEMMMS